jgi:hypothetical protein
LTWNLSTKMAMHSFTYPRAAATVRAADVGETASRVVVDGLNQLGCKYSDRFQPPSQFALENGLVDVVIVDAGEETALDP